MTPSRRPGPVLVVGALVGVAVVMAALAGPWQPGHRFVPDVTPPVITPPVPSQESHPSSTGAAREVMPLSQERWIFFVILAVLALVAVVVLGLVIGRLAQKLRERQAGRDVDAADPDIGLEGDVVDVATAAMRAGATQAAQVLEQEVPPGDAVIAAWVALESSAERSGIPRDRAQTATEFTLEVLGSTHADPRAAQELLDLYLAARYSEHRLTQADVDRARSSLATIAQGLET
ncbi:DUF4129 domain-containing protein [Cellulomonas sp. McL0617]|uniref:DUF4129 domain-containing protein n=1 Tax=Cellulomonas sp. McL0617 TaxID=3415675 RepID=UPI003CF1EA4C